MNALPRFVCWLLVGLLLVGLLLVGRGAVVNADDNLESERQQVLDFCERFAGRVPEELPDARGGRYLEKSAAVRQYFADRVIGVFSNFFQPPDSRFVGVWHCSFQIVVDEKTCAGKVSLPIAEYKAFAEHTQWPKLKFIRDNQLTGPDGDAAGYITPKYYNLNCPKSGESAGEVADE